MFKANSFWLRCGCVAVGMLGVAGLASAAASDASGSRQSMSDMHFTGPLVAPNATALPAGHWDIEPYLLDAIQYGQYDDDWHQHNTPDSHGFRSVTLIEYGLTDRFSVGLLPQFGFNHNSGGENSDGLRLGDMTLRAHYMFHQFHEGSLIPTMAFAVSENLPTGDYDGLDKVANGLGSGVWSTKVAFWSQDYFWMPNGHILRTRFDVSYEFPDDNNVSVNGRSVYGTGPGFSGRINPADTFTANAAAEYGLTKHWAPAIDVVYSYTGSGQTSGQTTQIHDGQLLPTTHVRHSMAPSQAVEVDPALEYLWNQHFGLIVGAQVTVAGRNTGSVVTPQAALNVFY